MSSPADVVDDGDHEQIVARVAAIDIGKQIGKVCTRVPHETKEGRRYTRVWDVPSTTGSINDLFGVLDGLQHRYASRLELIQRVAARRSRGAESNLILVLVAHRRALRAAPSARLQDGLETMERRRQRAASQDHQLTGDAPAGRQRHRPQRRPRRPAPAAPATPPDPAR